MRPNAIRFLTLNALIVLAGSLLSPVAQAQSVYRIIGADGKVTFSDQPPPASYAKVSAANVSSTGAAASAGLPFELRQVATKYPVTLYTGANCAPCGAGRSLLTSRGIPFTEKTVTTNEDAQTLQRLSGDNSLPFMTIGSQQLKGFSDSEWTQFLNAAGYPPSSVLPASYRRPEPTPL
ncbi:MAG: glutaredoxin family protein, partial [Polaromonas sp.]|nr:glutaredoxin family protein [Polaromonas sp.]